MLQYFYSGRVRRMLTYAVLEDHAINVPPHLEPMDPIPVLGGLQAQGDVYIRPLPNFTKMAMASGGPVTWRGEVEFVTAGVGFMDLSAGYEVVDAWDAENRHFLIGDGCACKGLLKEDGKSSQEAVFLKVPKGGSAYLIHTEEHGANGIGPGCYVLYQQRSLVNGREETVAD